MLRSVRRPTLALALATAFVACTCEQEATTGTEDPVESRKPFEDAPPVEVSKELPDPLWARELSRLPHSAQAIVLVNPEKLRKALAGGVLRDRVEQALSGFGGAIVLTFVDGLLEELDPSRPIAVAAFAVPDEDLYLHTRLGVVTDPDLVPPFIHNRALLPTRDPARLIAAADPLWERLGFRAVAEPVGLPAGALLFTRPESDEAAELSVVLIPEQLGVRVELLWGSFSHPARHGAAMRRVAAAPVERARAETPAVRQLLVQKPLVGALYEPEGVASFSLALALIEANQAVRATGSELRPSTWARGVAIALVGHNILDPRDRIHADSTFAVELERDRGLELYTTTSVTPLGAKIGSDALEASGHVFDPLGEPPALLLQGGESMRASAANSEALRWGRQLELPRLRERWSWAGGPAVQGALTSSRWPTLVTLQRVIAPEELDIEGLLPDAFTIVVPKVTEDPSKFEVALAFDYRAQVDTAPAVAALEGLAWPGGAKPEVERREVGDRQVVLVGVGVEPASVLDLESPRRRGPIERVDVKLDSAGSSRLLPLEWTGWFETVGPNWASWVDVVGTARFVQSGHGASLVGAASIAVADENPPPPTLRAFTAKVPQPTEVFADGRGWHCLRDIPHVAVGALDQLSNRYSTSPSRFASRLGLQSPDWNVVAQLAEGEDESSEKLWQRSIDSLDQVWATVEPLIVCGESDPPSEPYARRVRASWLTSLADWADGLPEPERARKWGEQACELGSERACRRLAAIEQRSTVAVPVRDWLSYPLFGKANAEIVVSTRKVHFEGKPVVDLPRALEEHLAVHHLPGSDVAIFADASATYEQLAEVTSQVLATGLTPQLVLRDPRGRLMALEVTDEETLARVQGDDATLRDLDPTRPRLVRAGDGLLYYRLTRVSGETTWGQLSERLLVFGELGAEASEGERMRFRAVGSSAAVPTVVFGSPR